MDQRIHAAKPWVRFGISPFGIWRNAGTDPLGSQTSGLQSYDAIYADTRKWVKQGWVDYIAPQIYWHIGFATADYAVLTAWWAGVVQGTGVQLYIGQAAYRAGAAGQDAGLAGPRRADRPPVPQPATPAGGRRHLLQRQGRAGRPDRRGHPAGRPTTTPGPPCCPPAARAAAPAGPAITSATRGSGGVALAWQPAVGSPLRTPIYRVDRLPGRRGPVRLRRRPQPAQHDHAETHLHRHRRDGRQRLHLLRDRPGPAATRKRAERRPAVAAAVGRPFSVVVDNRRRRFTASANWGTSTFSAQRYGADYRFADPVAASDPAWFQAQHPQRRQLPGRGLVSGQLRLQQRDAVHRGGRRRQPDRHRGPARQRRPVAQPRHVHPRRRRPTTWSA